MKFSEKLIKYIQPQGIIRIEKIQKKVFIYQANSIYIFKCSTSLFQEINIGSNHVAGQNENVPLKWSDLQSQLEESHC